MSVLSLQFLKIMQLIEFVQSDFCVPNLFIILNVAKNIGKFVKCICYNFTLDIGGGGRIKRY